MKHIALLLALAVALIAGDRPEVIYVDAWKLQEAVDAAAPHSTLIADRNDQVEITKTVRIDKPLTLVGLNARLKAGLGKTPILLVVAEEVHIRDFILEGNGDSVTQAERAPLIEVQRGRFVIEDGQTLNSAKDGIMISPVAEYGDIEHGVVRHITGRNIIRDVVSMSGAGDLGFFLRHLVVENIRSYGSELRGPVEVSDGSEHITVRDIYAENCAYGVDVQDHGRKGMVNRHIVIEGVHVKNTDTAIRTANHDFGHDGLTIRNVTVEDWKENTRFQPLDIKNTSNVVIDNVQIHGAVKGPAVLVKNGDHITIRNVTVTNSGQDDAAVVVEDSRNTVIDNVVIIGDSQPEIGVAYRVRADERFGGLRITNVIADQVRGTGIVVENLSEKGGLDSFLISGNMATVEAKVKSKKHLVEGNL